MKACATEGITAAISETLCAPQREQDAPVCSGSDQAGQSIVTNAKGSSYRSQHQWGIAFDFYLRMDIDGDGKISDDAYNDSKGHFKRAAEIAKNWAFAWGGDWKSIVDKPHLYLPDWGSTLDCADLVSGSELLNSSRRPVWLPEQIRHWLAAGGRRLAVLLSPGRQSVRYVVNAWYQDEDKWYWFDGAGMMVHNTWYIYNGGWYYLGDDGVMRTGLQTVSGKWLLPG
ncbi:MAG: M15 family metallopeptidase [Clostridium sp.]